VALHTPCTLDASACEIHSTYLLSEAGRAEPYVLSSSPTVGVVATRAAVSPGLGRSRQVRVPHQGRGLVGGTVGVVGVQEGSEVDGSCSLDDCVGRSRGGLVGSGYRLRQTWFRGRAKSKYTAAAPTDEV
jgi:hypothetical protein